VFTFIIGLIWQFCFQANHGLSIFLAVDAFMCKMDSNLEWNVYLTVTVMGYSTVPATLSICLHWKSYWNTQALVNIP